MTFNDRFRADRTPSETIDVVGVGAVGSYVAPVLASWGAKLRLWDPDRVGTENVLVQGFEPEDVGRYKAEAITNKVLWRARLHAANHPHTYLVSNVRWSSVETDVFLCVDNMTARTSLAESERAEKLRYVVDTRTGFTFSEVRAYDFRREEHRDMFKASLFQDDEAADEPCGRRMHPIVAMFTAAWACSIYRSLMNGKLGNRTCFQLDHEHMAAYGDMVELVKAC